MLKSNISGSLNFPFHDILKYEERRYKAYGKYLICTEMVPYLNLCIARFAMHFTYNQPVNLGGLFVCLYNYWVKNSPYLSIGTQKTDLV